MTDTALQLLGYVALPAHVGKGGFDHAAVHAATGHVYVAHTANDAVDVFDPASGKHLYSVPSLPGVAGALVSDEAQLIISSNRAENTIGIFAPGPNAKVVKVAVGVRPNGLAFDPKRRQILVANVGDPSVPGSHTLTIVDADAHTVRGEVPVRGRTRWAVYEPEAQVFYINIADPAEIVMVNARNPLGAVHAFAVPSAGPHGLDLDLGTRRLFCACDSGALITLDAGTGKVVNERPLSGAPDVVFFNPVRRQLYVAAGDPGVIDVFDTETMKRLATIPTESGAHTFALAAKGNQIYAFLPKTHRAAIYDVT